MKKVHGTIASMIDYYLDGTAPEGTIKSRLLWFKGDWAFMDAVPAYSRYVNFRRDDCKSVAPVAYRWNKNTLLVDDTWVPHRIGYPYAFRCRAERKDVRIVYVSGLLKLCSNNDCSYFTPPSMSNIVDMLIGNAVGTMFGVRWDYSGPASPRFTTHGVFDVQVRDIQEDLNTKLKLIGSRRKFDIRKHFMKDGIMRTYAAHQLTKGGNNA